MLAHASASATRTSITCGRVDFGQFGARRRPGYALLRQFVLLIEWLILTKFYFL